MISRKELHAARRQRKKRKLGRLLGQLSLVLGVAVIVTAYFLWPSPEKAIPDEPHHLAEGEQPQPSPNEGTSEGGHVEEDDPREDDPELKPEHETEPLDQEEIEPDKSGNENSKPRADRVTFSFVGDVMMADNVEKLVKEHGYAYPFLHVKEALQKADFTIANLETSVTRRGEPENKSFTYRTSPEALPALLEAGIDVVSIANNHILDYGLIGFMDTMEHLLDAGLPYVGGGRNKAEAYEPVILEKDGIKVAFLGFSMVVPEAWWKADTDRPGVAETYDYRGPVAAIEKAKEEADLVVVIPHWGKEREDYPVREQTEMAHRYIDAGADLVVGSHPHVLQGAEQYKGKWIFYSLGNFVFTTNANHEKTWESVILNAACTADGECELDVLPVQNKWAQPRILEGEEAARLLKRLDEITTHADVTDKGKILAETP